MTSGKIGIGSVVLIAAIFLLIGWALIPTMTHHGGGSRKTQCLSNVKQLGLASLIYMSDYDDRLMNRDRWMDAIEPYHKLESIAHCPGVARQSDANPSLYGYAFNAALSEKDAKKIPSQEQVPMIFDSVSLWRNVSDFLQSLPEPPRDHGGTPRNVVGFLDGHARIFTSNAAIPRFPAKPVPPAQP